MIYHVFFMCSTIVEVDDETGKEILHQRMGRLRESYPIMNDVLQRTGVAILAYPTYQEWLQIMPGKPHKVIGTKNVLQAVSDRLPN